MFVNRNLRLDKVEMVGFDMDYTLALYNQTRIEELSIRATLDKLVTAKRYPEAIRALGYDPQLRAARARRRPRDLRQHLQARPLRMLQGAPVTASRPRSGATRSPNSTSASARIPVRTDATPGSTPCSRWQGRAVRGPRRPTSFASSRPGKPAYNTMWEDIRECIDLAHRDGSIKTIVSAQLSSYIERDDALAETLHKFRSSGKRLFLLTNSAWDYTTTVMSYLLDGALAAYPNWKSYFDVVVVSAAKPEFFTEEHPFIELDQAGEPAARQSDGPFQRGRIYQGGNLKTFEERARTSGDRVLFVGDHIYGDMLRSRKSSNWRTAMVLQEMEHEVSTYDHLRAELSKLDRLDAELIHLDAELNERQSSLRARCRSSATRRPAPTRSSTRGTPSRR